jgi:hypothetical protein
MEKYEAVMQAAGFRVTSPNAINASVAVVEDWVKQGLDFDAVVLPAIRQVVAMSKPDDRTRTLGRFRHAIAREDARHREAANAGRIHRPTEPPFLEPEGEDPLFWPLRAQLLERLGHVAFVGLVNRSTFEDLSDDAPAGSRPMRVKGPDAARLLDSERGGSVIRGFAKAVGFTAVWNA